MAPGRRSANPIRVMTLFRKLEPTTPPKLARSGQLSGVGRAASAAAASSTATGSRAMRSQALGRSRRVTRCQPQAANTMAGTRAATPIICSSQSAVQAPLAPSQLCTGPAAARLADGSSEE